MSKRKIENEAIIDLCDSDDDNNKNIIDMKQSSSTTSTKSSTTSTSASASTTSSSSSKKPKTKKLKKSISTTTKYKIFCDLDGVLVDFDRGALSLFHNNSKYKSISSIPSNILWSRINSSSSTFFRDLHWTNDGMDLWKTLVQLYFKSGGGNDDDDIDNNKPEYEIESLSILTGCSRSHSSKTQKFEWCQRHLHLPFDDDDSNNNTCGMKLKLVHVDKAAKKSQHEIVRIKNTSTTGMKSISSMFQQQSKSGSSSNKSSTNGVASKTTATRTCTTITQKRIDVITCWSKNKHYESKKNHILIDDRIKLKDEWISKGGIFIHHTSTIDTIRQLKELGFLL